MVGRSIGEGSAEDSGRTVDRQVSRSFRRLASQIGQSISWLVGQSISGSVAHVGRPVNW